MNHRSQILVRCLFCFLAMLLVSAAVGRASAETIWRHTLRDASQLNDGRYRDLKYSDREWYGSTFFAGPDWTRVGKDWHHPGQKTPSVRCFVVPRDGQVTVSGRVFKLHREGDGVRAIIRHNRREVWKAEIDGDDGEGVTHRLALNVREKDRIRFVVHKLGGISCDTAGWDPVVQFSGEERYQASVGFAKHLQGAGGWRYEMQVDVMRDAGLPLVYSWTPQLALQQYPVRPEKPVELTSREALPLMVVAAGNDRRGLAITTGGQGPWRFVATMNAEGDVQLSWHGACGEEADASVWSEPYRGSWPEGWKSVDACLAANDRLAVPRKRIASQSNSPRMSLALRAMVQSDWRQQDSIDGSGESYVAAAQRQLERATEFLENLRAEHGRGFLGDESLPLDLLSKKIDRGFSDVAASRAAWLSVRRLKRRVAMSNPLLDFGPLLVCKRVPPSWSHLVAQYFGWRQRPGGGLYVIEDPGHSLEARDILRDQLPPGSVLEPRLSYDGQRVLFSFVACSKEVPDSKSLPVNEQGTAERYFDLYEIKIDGSGLRQLTNGPYDDMMGEYLPNGDIVFCSTRRKGYSRCFGPEYSRRWHSYTLHRMDADGGNIRTLSYNDVAEWFPAVSNSGRILHARWDYIDRDAVTHQNLWAIRPDGTNPVAVWGNATPVPHCVFQAKPIPHSNKIVFIGAAHHAITAGPVCVLDPAVDANSLDAVTRVTPLPFPEAEGAIDQWYAAPWPLSEDYYLVAYSPHRLRFQGEHMSDPNPDDALGIYLLDANGNRELLYRDPDIGTTNPTPLTPRWRPPILPDIPQSAEPETGTMVLTDIHEGLGDVARETITELRIVQVFPKTTWLANQPQIGVAGEENGRAILGTVPIEADGSAHFRVPAATPILFQALDERGMAYQTMRSLTFVQPGERTACVGCHEQRMSAPPSDVELPQALRRPPSIIEPGELGGRPFGFVEVVQTILDQHCVRCHGGDDELNLTAEPYQGFTRSYLSLCRLPQQRKQPRGHPELLREALVPRFVQRNQIQVTPPGGIYGARGSRLTQLLIDGHEGVKLSPEELYRFATWIDMNAIFYGVYDAKGQARQLAGETVEMPDIQ